MSMRFGHLLGLGKHGFHRIHYTEWGAADNPRVLMCVHGLTRNGRDFDSFAAAMSSDYRVICPDIIGRGCSDWLEDKSEYSYPQYLADMTALIARSGVTQVDWLGTSMGGLIGMLLAAQPRSPIRHLVVNDVGPLIPHVALQRIAAYVGQAPDFPDLVTAEAYVRQVAAPFGPLNDAQWHHLTVHTMQQRADGRYAFAYDPGIAQAFREASQADVDLWPVWEQLDLPILVIRGAESDVLRHADAVAMTERGPGSDLIEFAGVGHAPVLMDPAQITPVRDWLLAKKDGV